jgi:hypothetical protein
MGMDQSQQIATEHRDLAAHAHRAGAEHHGKEDHLTGQESSRLGLEHSNKTYLHLADEHPGTRLREGIDALAHEANERHALAQLAYQLWQGRGCPEGSPEQDWSRAVEVLRTRH